MAVRRAERPAAQHLARDRVADRGGHEQGEDEVAAAAVVLLGVGVRVGHLVRAAGLVGRDALVLDRVPDRGLRAAQRDASPAPGRPRRPRPPAPAPSAGGGARPRRRPSRRSRPRSSGGPPSRSAPAAGRGAPAAARRTPRPGAPGRAPAACRSPGRRGRGACGPRPPPACRRRRAPPPPSGAVRAPGGRWPVPFRRGGCCAGVRPRVQSSGSRGGTAPRAFSGSRTASASISTRQRGSSSAGDHDHRRRGPARSRRHVRGRRRRRPRRPRRPGRSAFARHRQALLRPPSTPPR